MSGPGRCDAVATLNDPAGRLAPAYGLHRPRSGGPSVGYAMVDGRGRVRCRTIDPTVDEHLAEVATIVGAVG